MPPRHYGGVSLCTKCVRGRDCAIRTWHMKIDEESEQR